MSAELSKDYSPSREDFAAMLADSLAKDDLFEGSVVKGKVVGIEKDLAVIDVGLKMEGRVPVKEFGIAGQPSTIKVGDSVRPSCLATRHVAKRAGPGSKSNSRPTRKSRA